MFMNVLEKLKEVYRLEKIDVRILDRDIKLDLKACNG